MRFEDSVLYIKFVCKTYDFVDLFVFFMLYRVLHSVMFIIVLWQGCGNIKLSILIIRVGGADIEIFVILTMRTFNFAVMSWCIRTN